MRLNALWWWIDRWRKSTAYTDMTLEEQGAYRNLLDEAHLRGGFLPNSDKILAKVCGDSRAWKRVKVVVLSHFQLGPDGWHNETLTAVLAQSLRRAERQAAYRQRRSEPHNAADNVLRNAPRNAEDNKGHSPSPSPSHVQDQDQDLSHTQLAVPTVPVTPSPRDASPSRRGTLQGSGVMAGSRAHRAHAWCAFVDGRYRGVCVPDNLHTQLIGQHGGDPDDTDATLKAWYETVVRNIPVETPIGDDVFTFWRCHFTAAFGSVAPPPPSVNERRRQAAERAFLHSEEPDTEEIP